MKRVIVLNVILLILLLNLVSAANAPGVIQENIEDKIGVSADTFKDPQQLKDEYLQKNWAELIAKNRILGPIQNFLITISPILRVFFGEPYSFTLVFLFVVILWLITVRDFYILAKAYTLFNGLTALVLSLAAVVILAQIGFLHRVSALYVDILISKEMWWMRLLLILVAVVLVFALNYGVSWLSHMIKKAEQQKRDLTLKESVTETRAFFKGIKKGQEITKK